jgi:hypothetical protein
MLLDDLSPTLTKSQTRFGGIFYAKYSAKYQETPINYCLVEKVV